MITCSKCGSTNVTMQSRPPSNNPLDWLMSLPDILRDKMNAKFGRLPMGEKFIVCKDCGHISIVHVL